jgi:RNA polymerase sigma factor (sigma-70 family)
VQWNLIGCDKTTEDALAREWPPFQAELEAKAELLDADPSSQIRMLIEHSDQAPQWLMQAAIYTPRGNAIAESRNNERLTAMRQLVDGLSQRIDELAERSATVFSRRQGLEGIAAFLKASHDRGNSHQFVALLDPVLQSLRPFINRELRSRHGRGEIQVGGMVTPRDIRDQTLVRTWERFDEWNAEQPLDLWLIGVIDDVLDQYAAPLAAESLQDRQRTDTETIESRRFEWTEGPDQWETTAISELIPEGKASKSWARLDNDAKQAELEQFLQHLPRSERHVLMLNTIGGFSVDEIADFQNRSSDDVHRDLANAREIATDYFQVQHSA